MSGRAGKIAAGWFAGEAGKAHLNLEEILRRAIELFERLLARLREGLHGCVELG